MSGLIWEVSEPADDAVSGVSSGTIDLDNVRVVSRTPPWQIELSDRSVALVPQPGGRVEAMYVAADKHTGSLGIVSRGVVTFGLVVFILLVAVLVIHDIFTKSLTFIQFVQVMLSFLAGLGFRNYIKVSNQRESQSGNEASGI